MKQITSLIAAAALSLSLSACSGGSSAASKLNGTWTGEPVAIDGDSVSIDGISVYTFDYHGQKHGNVALSSMLSIDAPLCPTDSLLSTGWITAAGLASMQGTYSLRDNGIALKLDPATFQLIIDDEATRLTFDTVNPEEMPGYTDMRDSCAKVLRNSLPELIRDNMLRDTIMSDITFTNDIFTALLPSSSDPVTFRRQIQE